MTKQFRIANRTLCLGLLSSLTLVSLVYFKGVHPSVLLTFQAGDRDIQLASSDEIQRSSLQFAQVESNSRLDAPASIRAAIGHDSARMMPPRNSSTAEFASTAEVSPSFSQMPQLPPLPGDADHGSFEVKPNPPEAEILNAPAEITSAENDAGNDLSVAIADSVPDSLPPDTDDSHIEAAESPVANTVANPMLGSPPALHPAQTVEQGQGREQEQVAKVDSQLAEKLSALQQQLEKMASDQEKQRASQQSWMESSQLMQQEKLQGQMRSLEAILRELKEKSERPVPPAFVPQPGPLAASEAVAAIPQTVREEKPGLDGEKRFSIESQGGVRELLNALTQKANLNLVLSINVEGDVEMSLQNATADEALKAIEKSTGYVVEKDGQRVYVHPNEPVMHQREGFLPPIIKAPSRTRAIR